MNYSEVDIKAHTLLTPDPIVRVNPFEPLNP